LSGPSAGVSFRIGRLFNLAEVCAGIDLSRFSGKFSLEFGRRF
jgi:hypothetical protein